MGIYDGKPDRTLSGTFKRFYNSDPVELQGIIEAPSEFLEQLAAETEITDDIKNKFLDVCKYMFEHRISSIESHHKYGVKFKINMELPAEWSESKRAAEIGEGIAKGLAEALKGEGK